MSYENAPATVLLATACACCGRPLVDAVSVETGMGPHCRKAHGYAKPEVEVDLLAVAAELAAALPPELYVATVEGCADARQAANRLVHRAAVEQSGPVFVACVVGIAALGFTHLAKIMTLREKGIVVRREQHAFLVFSPFSPDFVARAKKIGGKWTPKPTKAWAIPLSRRGELWGVLKASYPAGTPVSGEKGVKVL
jgi:hypothetical protein